MSPSDEVTLRPVQAGDLDAFYRDQLDVVSNQMAVANPRDATTFHTHWARILTDPEVTVRAVLSDGLLVGQISCFRMEDEDAVGYWIGREHWGRGVASRALALLLTEVSRRPLHARVARTNLGSIRVLERCGFTIVGYQLSAATERFPACEEALLVLRS